MGATAIAWFVKNPLAGGLALLCGLLTLGLGLQTLRLSWSQESLAESKQAFSDYKLEASQKSLNVMIQAKTRSDEETKKLLDEIKQVGIVASQAKTEVRLVQSNGGPCDKDPAYIAGVAGAASVLGANAKGSPAQRNQGQTGRGAPTPLR
jgi:hypothetical protein